MHRFKRENIQKDSTDGEHHQKLISTKPEETEDTLVFKASAE